MNGKAIRGQGVFRRLIIAAAGVLAVLLLCFGLAACGPTEGKITLNKFETTIAVGQAEQLEATVEGGDAQEIVWSTSDAAVATVADGLVTAVAEGSATITASLGEAEASCVVTVTSDAMPVIRLDRTTAELVVGGKSITAAATVAYDGDTVQAELTWASSDPSVCTVENGVIAPVGVGSATVTVTAVYEGKTSQATISVKVSPDITVSVSEDVLTLVTFALNDGDMTAADISVSVLSGGKIVEGAKVELALKGDSASAELKDGVLHVSAQKEGKTIVTLSYAADGVSTQTTVEIDVIRPYQELGDTFAVNIKDTNAVLDFSAYDWAEEVTAIYAGETLISDASDPCLIDADWLAMRVVGTTERIRIVTEDYDIYATLALKNDLMTVHFNNAEAASSYEEAVEEVPAFGDVSPVWQWTTTTTDHWANRLTLEESISEYDWWIFDIVPSKALTANLTFWIANNHVVQLTPGGGTVMLENGGYSGTAEQHAAESCIRVFDSNNRIVIGAMKPGERYTIEISLAHRGDRDIYDFGSQEASTFYLANAFACSAEYYNANIGPYRNTDVETDLRLTAEKNIASTHALDFGDAAWKDSIQGMYLDDRCISEENAPATLDAEWVASANAGLYEIVIRLTSGETVNALLDLRNSVAPVTLASTDARYSSFEKTEDAVDAFAGTETVYQWKATQANVWDTRIKSAADLSSYGYWIFDIVLTAPLTQDITLWIGTNHAIDITPDGSVNLAEAGTNYAGNADQHAADNCVRIFDADNKIVIGALKPNVRYTIEVRLAHHGNGDSYAVGLGEITTAYVANAFVCTADYYEEEIAPSRDTEIDIQLNFVIEKYVPATHTLDFSTYAWENKAEGIYLDGTRITQEGSPNVLDEAWLSGKNAGRNLVTVKLNDGTEMEAILTIQARIMNYSFYLPDGGNNAYYQAYEGDETALGFDEGTAVWEYYSGDLENNNWNNRISSREALGTFDWWIFDIVFAEDLFTGDASEKLFVIWVGSGHVVELYADGSMKIYGETAAHEPNCISVYDETGAKVTGALKPNVKYTFEISLAHKGNLELYEIGAYVSTTYYIANCMACTDGYYQENIAGLHEET